MTSLLLLSILATLSSALPPSFRLSVFQASQSTLFPSKVSSYNALRTAIADAASHGSSLFICPELYDTGYNPTALYSGEARGGASYTAAAALALEYNISLAWTYTELDPATGKLYDSLVLFNRSGVALVDYRKVNLAGDGEALLFTPGEALAPVVELEPGLRVGVMICFDIFLPEPARVLAVRGADLVLVPTANGYPGSVFNQLANLIVPARALENNAFVVYNNWFQAASSNTSAFPEIFSFYGQSVVYGPGGQLLWQGPADRGILAHVDLNLTNYSPGSTAQGRPAADTQGLCAA